MKSLNVDRRRLLRGAVATGAVQGGRAARVLGPLAAAASAPLLGGCERSAALIGLSSKGSAPPLEGGFVGTDAQRGHLLRDGLPPTAGVERRCAVLIVGGGVAGLAAARALARAGIDDYRLLELSDEVGGNSRGMSMATPAGALMCPLGAHYLPVPGPAATEVAELLGELGVRSPAGVYDERMLCHAPQERLLIHGVWQEGLVPSVAQPAGTFDEYARFADLVDGFRRTGSFAIPTVRARDSLMVARLQATSFARWLDAQGLHSPGLRWYLDYCCRDDYGAGIEQVSAWAGVHYFASRHGFTVAAPGTRLPAGEGEPLLTWPQGNGWLVERLAAPHAARTATGRVALSASERRAGDRREVVVEAYSVADGRRERWIAAHVVIATPAFVAARLIDAPGSTVAAAAGLIDYAPWLVANLLIEGPVSEAPGAARAWDNVLYGSDGLGYVDARHQLLASRSAQRESQVWTWYQSFGGPASQEQRRALLDADWRSMAEQVVAQLERAHRGLRARVRRVDIARYGHAMAVPRPGLQASGALEVLRRPLGRMRLAHADLSGYSIFEEAFHWGTQAGTAVASALSR